MAASAYFDTIQKMYIAYFGRPADPIGLEFWAKKVDAAGGAVTEVIAGFAASNESQALFGNKTSAEKVNAIYNYLFDRDAEPAGLSYWAQKLDSGEVSQAAAMYEILSNAGAGDVTSVNNKLAAAKAFTAALDTSSEILGYSGASAAEVARVWLTKVNAETASKDAAIAGVDATVSTVVAAGQNGNGQSVTLTNGTDVQAGNVFNAGLVYTPAGNDRINSLQSEDVLTGIGVNPTLNATLGMKNDNGAGSITPTLKNIETINLDVTGDTNTLDVRFADSLKNISINKLTAEATNGVTVDNIGQPAANLAVKNSALVGNDIKFQYVDGVLGGTTAAGNAETGNLTLANVNAKEILVGNQLLTEGFETLNLSVSGTNQVSKLTAVDLENLKISGSGNLSVVNTTQQTDRVQYNANGLAIGDGLGIRTIDASGFNGTLNLDITAALGGHADPANSGSKYYASITGSAGGDTFWANKDLAAESATLKDVIAGGAGTDTLKLIDANIKRGTDAAKSLATVTGIEALDVRLQAGNAAEANLAAFDSALVGVTLRNEQSTGATAAVAGTFTLREVGKTVAESGITLLHASGAGNAGAGTPTGVVDTVAVRLADSTGAADLVTLTVKSDLNTSSTYDYKLDLMTEAAAAAGATDAVKAANKVENLTINDQDNETNTVTITGNDGTTAKDLTGTVTLTGGSAGKGFTVATTLLASVIDASTQASNLTLTVGQADQTIKLGTGDDTLTFDGVDTFNGSDVISDAGGTDTVRAAFSKDVVGTPDLAGIEKLHLVATANTTIDLVKGQGITELAILSDKAVDEANEIFSTGLTSVETVDVITLKNTKLTEVNFFGDEDAAVAGTTVSATQTFNGLNLENNSSDTLAVKISAPLKNLTNLAGNGITTYNLGQLTTHGVKTLSIDVANEVANKGTTTNIANIWDRDLQTLTLKASGNINVGTVTGNTTNNNIQVFDASAVGGNTTAVVKALGDNAKVTLGAGNDTFNALGSAGNNVEINGGNGNNTITGTAQSDFIYTGTGNDVIDADRGNNTIKSGAGDDTVSALNGSNTVDIGSGKNETVTFKYDTVGQLGLATNVVAGSGTSAFIRFDSNNDGDFVDVGDANYGFAVGAGAELSIKFTGTTFDATASTLNGRSAINVDGVTVAATDAGVTGAAGYSAAQSNLVVFTVNPTAGQTFNGGSAADVFLDLSTGAGTAYNVVSGAGNDAIVISQTSTADHKITAGTGADRIVLSAVGGGVDQLIVAEGDSTASGWDVVTGFRSTEDKIVSGTAAVAGVVAGLTSDKFDLNADGIQDTVTVGANGLLTITSGAAGTPVLVVDNSTIDKVLGYLATNATVNGNLFQFGVDTTGDGVADNTIVFQNLATDLVVELVGTTTFVDGDIAAAVA